MMDATTEFPTPRRSSLDCAEARLWEFTVVAAFTGAVPVPGASVAIVAENAAMVAVIAAEMGIPVTPSVISSSIGPLAFVNTAGRTVFVEGARLLAWGAGPLGLAPVCLLGALTAGLQTWVLGRVAIAICLNDGRLLSREQARAVVREAKARFEEMKEPLLIAVRQKMRAKQSPSS